MAGMRVLLLCAALALALAGAEEKVADDCVFLHGLGVDGSLTHPRRAEQVRVRGRGERLAVVLEESARQNPA